ncbi:MAG: nuclear transport factor 2 family protein [Bdellovibrionales bacterium]
MAEIEIQEFIDRETRAWDEKSVELLLSIFHPEMVWVWPTDPKNHDPMSWTSMLGKFDPVRWGSLYRDWFSTFQLVRNVRKTQRIFLTKEGDGAFAVVDVDTLWRSPAGEESHWLGRTCKTYVKTSQGWKMTAQVGVLDYSQ